MKTEETGMSWHRPLEMEPQLARAERRLTRAALVIGLIVLVIAGVIAARRPREPVLVAGAPLDWVLFAQDE